MISAWINPYNEKKCGTLKQVPSNDKYHHRQQHHRRPSSSSVGTYSKKNKHRTGTMNENYATTIRPNYHHYPDYAHSDGGSVTPPPSPSSSSSIVSLTNSSASSSNDNISYYILDPSQNNNNNNKKGASSSSTTNNNSQQPQQQTNSNKTNGATNKQTTDVDTELSNEFSCNLSINGSLVDEDVDDIIENEVDVHTVDDDDDLENEYVERTIKKAEEYEQSQQQLQQQQLDQQRLAVLSFEQVSKLNEVMNEHVSIHGRGNFPTLDVRLKDFVTLVREKLELDIQKGGAGMCVKDIRLNGGAASHVLAYEAQSYNDLDLIFAVEFSSNRHFDRVKSAVLSTLSDLLPDGSMRKRITPGSLREAYVGKMVKVNNDGDRWSLISLGNSLGHKNVELKFVDTMRRQFEFSVDSFQIVLDSLLLFYDCAELPISENFYPTVVGESVYGDFHEALYHLQNKLISTRQPEEIRGGGLLKYCNLLVRNYIPVDAKQIKKLERYMCSRFFIDFPDILQQRIKLEAYLRNHFWGVDEEPLQYHYLVHLHDVVESSTVCLMGHERRQTLNLIEHLALQVSCRERQKIQHQTHIPQQTLMLSPSSQPQQHQLTQQQQIAAISSHPQSLQQYQTVDTTQMMPQTQTIHLQAPQPITSATSQPLQSTVVTQQQPITATTTSTVTPQQIQLQPTSQPGLLYANGVYYAPDVPSPTAGHYQYSSQQTTNDLATNYNNNNNNNNHNISKSYTTTKNSFIDNNQTNVMIKHQNQQQQQSIKDSNLKRSHIKSNVNANFSNDGKKKHVKFAKSSTTTATNAAPSTSASKKLSSSKKTLHQQQKFNKSSINNVNNQKPVTTTIENTVPAEEAPSYYYYYYYPSADETTTPAIQVPMSSEEQQYYFNNVGGYYYYAIDGTIDPNYNEYLIQQAGNNETINLR
ncbi:hypothetical protein PVAND_008982 [Polypedilum vanderplanki]|uniref:polynucleotide adenylyltransferase n=1 Tax=Polypedilum vanderplanki TaxID=319348 RepID=A0A9J6CBP5_POLVA|nr:hypothetical protein PVAND_008982 [Polypedilum vanderplanki]